jgi:EF-hand domain-containing protein 1
MTSVYPKQPGYNIYHDPTKVDFKKVSSMVLERVNNGEFKYKKDYNLPRQNQFQPSSHREGSSLSVSQTTHVNHFDNCPPKELFQPDWVKLDKQVLRFFGYFKETVDESKIEYARIRKLRIMYYLVDDTIEMIEDKEMNSGMPQGGFIKRAKIPKPEKEEKFDPNNFFKFQNNKTQFYTVRDLIVGTNLDIYGKIITITSCDTYTKEFYSGHGITQPDSKIIPEDSYHLSKTMSKLPTKKDNSMKDFVEHSQGGGKVKNQKQFLENDRRVLKFNANHDSLKYVINYYLADDTVEIKELFFNNSGRNKFPLFLKRNKLPKKFSVTQPGEEIESDYVTPADIEVSF